MATKKRTFFAAWTAKQEHIVHNCEGNAKSGNSETDKQTTDVSQNIPQICTASA